MQPEPARLAPRTPATDEANRYGVRLDTIKCVCYSFANPAGRRGLFCLAAGVAQLVEQLICNQQVGGSKPFASSIDNTQARAGPREGRTIAFEFDIMTV